MAGVQELMEAVKNARQSYLARISSLTEAQSQWKPDENSWNITDITEHLFWAEQGGIVGMWKVLHASRLGKPAWEGDEPHAGLNVEAIIEKTWKEKEIVPTIAAPRFGGPLIFWSQSLDGLQQILSLFCNDLQDAELSIIAHPHPISGPMNMHQRLEFLRFHIQRHEGQVEAILRLLPGEEQDV